jgi:alkanesulfonate monooxygenase SsuD/methylene tetrahydromethanopterin reductase-like flavin-dependent oxidoreductase (luciferase family)
MLAIAMKAEQLGFGSLWVGEHVAPKWDRETPLYDGMTTMIALAAAVPRVELGFVVLNTTFRPASMTAKMASTLDAISGSRLTLGVGAGFREVEHRTYGFDFPPLNDRLASLTEHLEIISRMTTRDAPPFSFEGRYARVDDVVNAPRTGGRDHIPLLIGGHGPNVTFRLAARFCDEINIDVMPDKMPASIAVLHERCAEIGRDPATMTVSSSLRGSWPYRDVKVTGGQRMIEQVDMPAVMDMHVADSQSRVEELRRWRESGIDRLVCGVPGLATTDEPLYELIEHLEAAGIPFPEPR